MRTGNERMPWLPVALALVLTVATPTEMLAQAPSSDGSYTVKEYRIYRALIDTPMSLPQETAMRNIAANYGVSLSQVRATAEKVMSSLSRNKWYGTPESEIRHASDWKGEKR